MYFLELSSFPVIIQKWSIYGILWTSSRHLWMIALNLDGGMIFYN